MSRLLLASAACLVATAAPAQAQFASGRPIPFVSPPQSQFGVSIHRGFPGDRDRRRRGDTVVVGGYGWSEGWALYNNRSFAPDSYNDWWHDSPDRSFPRWMQDNGKCQRVWWSGGGWRC